MSGIENLQLNFSPESLTALNVVLAIIMFGVALDIRLSDFRTVARSPKGPLIAVGTQILIVPALTVGLTFLLNPVPSIALGMILVACCPSGNMSNFLTHLAKGNTPLSIGTTALSTVAAVFVTPLSLAFWGSLNPSTAALLRSVALDPVHLLSTVLLILVLPLAVGIGVASRFPAVAERLRTPVRRISLVFFVAFVAIALQANFDHFLTFIGFAFLAVLLQNSMALATGYGVARVAGLPPADVRAVSIEVGIQNSGLGLVLVFNFFDGSGGMALVAAWWGIWHIISGLGLAWFWSRRPLGEEPIRDTTPV